MTAKQNAAFIASMQQLLKEEEAKLERELSKFAHRNPQQPDAFEANYEDTGTEEGENAVEVALYGDNLSLEKELEGALRDVLAALKAIADGSYGKCKYCKQLIGEDRLRARPTSTSCIACKKTLTQEV